MIEQKFCEAVYPLDKNESQFCDGSYWEMPRHDSAFVVFQDDWPLFEVFQRLCYKRNYWSEASVAFLFTREGSHIKSEELFQVHINGFLSEVNQTKSTLVSRRSQDYMPGSFVTVCYQTWVLFKAALHVGKQAARVHIYTVDLAQGVSVGQKEDPSNVKYDTMRCAHSG